VEHQPTPVCKVFILCRRLLVDTVRDEYSLVSPVQTVSAEHYPSTEDLSVFARWSNAFGAYDVEVQLRSFNGDILWRHKMDQQFGAHDTEQICVLPLFHLSIPFPAPGRYEVTLLANGQRVASDVLQALDGEPSRPSHS
jgi:hypothetical protein